MGKERKVSTPSKERKIDKELNLSEKRKLDCISMDKIHHYVYSEPDIKEFIRRERKIIDKAHFEDWSLTKTFKELDKLAGDKLC